MELGEEVLVHVLQREVVLVDNQNGFIKVVVDLLELLIDSALLQYQFDHLRQIPSNQSEKDNTDYPYGHHINESFEFTAIVVEKSVVATANEE